MPTEELYPDIVRPGDPNFTSFPRHLPEDCVQYTIHILTNPQLSGTALRSRLLEIQRAAQGLCKSLLSGYIWQREAFTLNLVESLVATQTKGPGKEGSTSSTSESHATKEAKVVPPWHLAGKTSFGDSIADEWLMVYLLRDLSRTFPDAWIRVVDADGEFLLVEAANVLPKWLNPEVAEHRVWINNGQLCIIPRELTVETSANKQNGEAKKRPMRPLPRELDLKDAFSVIAQYPDALIRSSTVEKEAFYRIRNYPSAIAESMHSSMVAMPRNLAYIIHRTPAHISAAVEAFYLRDPISLRPLQAKSIGKLKFPPNDFVTISVKFTRVGYAQLKSQDFTPPGAWKSALRNVERTDEWAKREIGMKVASGFEMLLADPHNQDKRSVREIQMLLEDVISGEEALPSDEDIKQWPQDVDDESWLDVNFEDFENELSGKKGGKKDLDDDGTKSGFGDKTAQENLRRMVERFEQFLNDDEAGIDGAEFSDEMDDDDDDDDDDNDSERSEASAEDQEVSFGEQELAGMMRQMMGMPTEESTSRIVFPESPRVQELASDKDSDEGDMQEVMQQMENELRDAGALMENAEGSNDHRLDDRQYLLAKNLLESFKGQAGAGGPTGSLMRSLGFALPRDHGQE